MCTKEEGKDLSWRTEERSAGSLLTQRMGCRQGRALQPHREGTKAAEGQSRGPAISRNILTFRLCLQLGVYF